MKLAIVGSGIAGLACAHLLRGRADITLLEAQSYFGGHTHTVDIELPTPRGLVRHGIDTGFLVFNERTYPKLIALFADLGVETAASDMSFSVKSKYLRGSGALEWNGANLNTVFAQRSNLLNWRFLSMLREIVRFNQLATSLAESGLDHAITQPLGEFLAEHRFGQAFQEWYFLPMMACIWSCPTQQMLQFPVSTMVRFCHNHGLIQVNDRPKWWTVKGGAKHYVEKIIAGISDKRLNSPVRKIERDIGGVTLMTDQGYERFDKVVLATHSDQALSLLHSPTAQEQQALGAIRFQANRAVLHTDERVLPSKKLAWAAWNYESAPQGESRPANVCLHYLINKLQPIPFEQAVVVSLNPLGPIPAELILGEYAYSHPVFDLAAIEAQKSMPALQGEQNTYFCGAWMGYGFHEDGLKAGYAAAEKILQDAQVAV
jgi:uncharacterized protein